MFHTFSYQKNVNKSHNQIQLHTYQNSKNKNSDNDKCLWRCRTTGKMYEQLLHICWLKCKIVQVLWKTLWQFLATLNMSLSQDPAIPLLYMNAYSSFIHNHQNWNESNILQFKCLFNWISKYRYIHTMNYYSVIKRNVLFIHATTWMNVKSIMLSERASIKTLLTV